MAKQLCTNYLIDGNDVTLLGVNVPLESILLISDATNGRVIYSLGGTAATAYSQAPNSTITVPVPPASDSAHLTIIYDDGKDPASITTSQIDALAAQVAGITTQLADLKTVQISNLQTEIVARLDITAELPVLGTVQVANLATLEGYAQLNSGQIASLAAVVAGMTTQLASLQTVQIGNTSPIPVQLEGFSLGTIQINNLGSQEVFVLNFPAVQSVQVTNLATLENAALVATGELSAIHGHIATETSQLNAIHGHVATISTQLNTLNSTQITALSLAQLQSLQLASLQTVTVANLQTQIAANIVNTSPLSVLGTTTIANLATAEAYLAKQTSQLESIKTSSASCSSNLTDIDLILQSHTIILNSIDNDLAQGLFDGDGNALLLRATSQLDLLRTVSVANLTTLQTLSALTTQQVATLNATQSSALSLLQLQSSQLATLSTVSIANLTTLQNAALTQTSQLSTISGYEATQTSQLATIAGAYTTNGAIKLETSVTAPFNLTQVGSNAIVASGSTQTARPLPMGGVDRNTTSRHLSLSGQGAAHTFGSGEMVMPYSFTSGSTTFTEGTNGKTYQMPPVECFFSLLVSITSSTTIVAAGSYDNTNWFALPFWQVGAVATTLITSFPVSIGNTTEWAGLTCGVPFLRIHQIAGASAHNGVIRVLPLNGIAPSVCSLFGFSAANTTESAGTSSGTPGFMTGGVRTIEDPYGDGSIAMLSILSMGGGGSVTLYGSFDGTTWTQVTSLNPTQGSSSGGAYSAVSSITSAGTYRAAFGRYRYLQVRCASITSGTILGYVKIIPVTVTNCGTSSTVTRFPTLSASATLSAANAFKKGVTIAHESGGTACILVGAGTASATNYTFCMTAGQVQTVSDFAGPISGFCASSAVLQVTEVV